MAGAESYVRVPADSTGKKLRTITDTIGSDTVHQEVITIADDTTLTQTAGVTASGNLEVCIAEETAAVTVDDGGSAISIDDGGNTITVDGTVSSNATLQTGSNIVGKVYLTDGTEDAAVNASNQLEVSVENTPSVNSTLQTGSNEIGNVKISDGTEQVNVNASSQLEVSVENNPVLGAGSNAIGKLAANSGVDIGDVDVASDPKSGVSYSVARIDTSSSGQTQVVAAQGAGNKIYVCGYQIQGKGDVQATFQSASTDIGPEWDFNAREGVAVACVEKPAHYMVTAANEALNVNLDAAVAVTGNVQYYVAS